MVLVSHKYKFLYLKNFKVGGTSVEHFFSKYCVNPESSFEYQDSDSHREFQIDGEWRGVDNTGDEHIDDYGIVGKVNGEGQEVWWCHSDVGQVKHEFTVNESLGLEKFEEYLKFCVIRNPYDKMVSLYFWQTQHPLGQNIWTKTGGTVWTQTPISFKEFIEVSPPDVCNNLKSVHGIKGESLCDYFIRYENLEEDIIKLCEMLNLPDYDINDLPHLKGGVRPRDTSYRDYYDEETKQKVYENHKEEFEMFGYEF